MTFFHERPEYQAVLRAAAADSPLKDEALVEKDYWVTHVLWALSRSGIALWFKGGTSLSKGFRITNRFSEDLDLVVGPGSLTNLPAVSSWRSTSKSATASRKGYWEAIVAQLQIAHVDVSSAAQADETYCNPPFVATYPGVHLRALSHPESVVTPSVLLEFADAGGAHCAVAPSVPRAITSFAHEYLAKADAFSGPDAVVDNRPDAVDCVHPKPVASRWSAHTGLLG